MGKVWYLTNPRILDLYPAKAEYSFRKLNNSYSGFCCKVREDGGDSEADISFVGGVLDVAAIASHCGVNNGFVTSWYDQSGNAYNLVQATASLQFRIYNGASVLTDANGHAAMASDSSSRMVNSDAAFDMTRPLSCVMRMTKVSTVAANDVFWETNGESIEYYHTATKWTLWDGVTNLMQIASNGLVHTHFIQLGAQAANTSYLRIDGAGVGPITSNGAGTFANGFVLGSVASGALPCNILLSELVFWDSAQIGNAPAIEADLAGYYA